tara:strand:+ start:3845 stop:5014 length:1170 start_codon:yes stop_codon:yes gene_type:complete
MQNLPLLIILILGISLIPYSFSEEIPQWVKNTADWWSERTISQSEFTNALEFLINEGIIYIPYIEPGIPGPDKIIPDWVRNNASWWSQDLIPDSEFINAMKYLIEIGIIEVDATSPEPVVSEAPVETEYISPLNIVLDGPTIVHADGKIRLDLKIFDSDDYSGDSFSIHRKGIDGVDVTIKLYTQEQELIHTSNFVTKYSGLVEYEILAKETSQDRGLWRINNTYTLQITATFNDQYGATSYQVSGVATEYDYSQGSGLKPPTNLTVKTIGNEQIELEWTAPKGATGITDYRIEYCIISPNAATPVYACGDVTNPESLWTVFEHDASDAVTDVVDGLTNNQMYNFRVAAINHSVPCYTHDADGGQVDASSLCNIGVGRYSNIVTATPTN